MHSFAHAYVSSSLSYFLSQSVFLSDSTSYRLSTDKSIRKKADRQFASGGSGLFDRGAIYFTRKDGTLISAATLATGFLVAINPQILADPDTAYTALQTVVPDSISRDAFLAAAAKKGQVYIEVVHRLSDADGQMLTAKNIRGVQVLRERWRQYPGGSLASQSIGIVSYGSGDTLGYRTGLERFYEGTLERSGDSLYKNFLQNFFQTWAIYWSQPRMPARETL